MSTWDRLFVALGGQHGSQNHPKMTSKRLQNRWKIDVEVDVVFACFQDVFLSIFGPNRVPKPLQMGNSRGGSFPPLLGSFLSSQGSWGPSWGSGGLRPSKTWFLSFFDRCWKHFSHVLGVKIPILEQFRISCGALNLIYICIRMKMYTSTYASCVRTYLWKVQRGLGPSIRCAYAALVEVCGIGSFEC